MSKALINLGTKSGGLPFCLPIDLATESSAIIARKGAGKTYTARVVSEDLLNNHIQTVVIDPLDVWWGLRLSADGKREGANVIIFGGSHADLPLTEHLGKTLADLIVDHGISAVLVTDHLSMAAQRRFVAAFCERLFERKSEQKHRTPLHLIIDEADAFAPQKPPPDAMPCLGAVDRIVRRGRSRGIGSMVITQRPAVLSKDVLTQTEVLIALQVVAPHDRAALVEWIKANADPTRAKEFLDSLAGLQQGEGWVWSPSRLKLLECVRIRKARTYDSSYTPKVGEKRSEPPRLRPADLDKLRGMLDSVVAEAKANDPKELRQRVRELEAQLAKKVAPAAIPKEALQRAFEEGYIKAHDEHRKQRKLWSAKLEAAARSVAYVQGEIEPGNVVDPARMAAIPAAPKESLRERVDAFGEAMARGRAAARTVRATREASAGDVKLGRAERAILTVLNRYSEGRTKTQVAIMTGYSSKGGGFNNALSRLRSCEMIGGLNGDLLIITKEGQAQVTGDDFPLPPPGEQLVHYWMSQLGKAERMALDTLWRVYPNTLTKEALAQQIDYQPTGGGFNNALSKLRTLELIVGRSDLSVNAAIAGDS